MTRGIKGVIGLVLEHGLKKLAGTELKGMFSFENVAVSIVTTRKGAIRSMTDKDKIDSLNARDA